MNIRLLDKAEHEVRPITILLVGRHSDFLSEALTPLSSSGRVLVVGTVLDATDAVVFDATPSLILASSSRHGRTTQGRYGTIQAHNPPILLCITYDDLETDDSYSNVDDIVVLPCTTAELYKRMERLISTDNRSTSTTLIRSGNVELDVSTYSVTTDGKVVSLAWMEYQLLSFLMQNTGRVFSRDQLLASVWEGRSLMGSRTVDVNIRRLRRKLGPSGATAIKTVKKVGYGIL